jgi:diguanylate cyclase (GGDEF)-like protein
MAVRTAGWKARTLHEAREPGSGAARLSAASSTGWAPGRGDAGDARLEALAEVGRRFSGATSRDELIDLAVEAALEVLDADAASIAIMEHDHGLLRVLRNAGRLTEWEAERPTDEVYRVADFPLLAAKLEDARPWHGHREDPAASPAYLALLASLGAETSVSLPILVGSTVWGEVGATRTVGRDRFGSRDLAAGMAFSGMLAAALGGLGTQEELRRLAYHDGLTGLANRRSVDDLLTSVFETPLERSVGVVVADVDGLKAVNDRHGHHLGDRLLRDVAVLISREASQFGDSLAARLGGDEFCLVLRGADEATMEGVAERLATEARSLPLGDGLSCGWAVVSEPPGDAHTPLAAAHALLRLADAAQYRAKRDGDHASGHGKEPVRWEPAELARRIADGALAALARSVDLPARLQVVGAEFATVTDAASWAVSVSDRGGPARIVTNEETRRLGREHHEPVEPGTGFDLDRYPATAAALRGGSFHATLDDGDLAERAYLAANAYDELIGAGSPDGDRAWLLEVAGDAASAPLAPLEGLLHVLVEHAVHGRAAVRRGGIAMGGRAPSP